MLFSRCFSIKTSLPKEEVIRILKQVTVPFKPDPHFLFVKARDYTFLMGKFENERFSCMPSPLKVPPYGDKNSLLPMIKGEILEKDGTEIRIEVGGSLIYSIFMFCYNAFFLLCIIGGKTEWIWILFVAGIDIILVIYVYIVSAKVNALFEELFGENSE